jgi:hypothetical protein
VHPHEQHLPGQRPRPGPLLVSRRRQRPSNHSGLAAACNPQGVPSRRHSRLFSTAGRFSSGNPSPVTCSTRTGWDRDSVTRKVQRAVHVDRGVAGTAFARMHDPTPGKSPITRGRVHRAGADADGQSNAAQHCPDQRSPNWRAVVEGHQSANPRLRASRGSRMNLAAGQLAGARPRPRMSRWTPSGWWQAEPPREQGGEHVSRPVPFPDPQDDPGCRRLSCSRARVPHLGCTSKRPSRCGRRSRTRRVSR